MPVDLLPAGGWTQDYRQAALSILKKQSKNTAFKEMQRRKQLFVVFLQCGSTLCNRMKCVCVCVCGINCRRVTPKFCQTDTDTAHVEGLISFLLLSFSIGSPLPFFPSPPISPSCILHSKPPSFSLLTQKRSFLRHKPRH